MAAPSSNGTVRGASARCAPWLVGAVAVLSLAVAAAYAWLIVFSRPMSVDEGYLMITIQGFNEGHPLYDSVFTHYGPFYYFYEWFARAGLRVPLTHDATRVLCIMHWLAAALLLGWAGRRLTGSLLGGLVVFMQAVVHLTAVANEPGHPQELVVVLLALGMLAASRGAANSARFGMLAVVAAVLAFTKVNVGVFFGFALLLAMRCHSTDRFARGAWPCLLAALCAALPFMLMRRHLTVEWCRNYSLLAAGTVVTTFVVAQWCSRKNIAGPNNYLRAGICGLAAATGLLGITLLSGTSLRGLMDGLVQTPLKMPSVALLPISIPNQALVNVACSLALAGAVTFTPLPTRMPGLITALKGLFGVAGSLWLVGDINAQFQYLLPWVWLTLVPSASPSTSEPADTFPRVFLCLAAAWQGLQAYPIAGTQLVAATILVVVAYTVCLADALRAARVPDWVNERLGRLQARHVQLGEALALVAVLGVFANIWCNLPAARRQHASLLPLDLPGSRHVRVDAETTELYRALAEYLGERCDTFVTYPGINSLYFWTGKRPPTQLNSTGWGQFSHRQQEQILAALRQSPRPLLVVVEAAMQTWREDSPVEIRPLIRAVREDYRPVRRIGRFVIFAPKTADQTARHD